MTKKPASQAPVAAQPTSHTIDDVIAAGQHFDPLIQKLVYRNVPEENLVARGQRLDSADILGAVPDFFSDARFIWGGLNAAQRKLVIGYTPEYDAILAHETGVLRDKHRAFLAAGSTSAADRVQKKGAANRARTRARKLRDQAFTALRPLIPPDDALALVVSKGSAETYTSMQLGVEQIAARIEQHRADAELAPLLDKIGLTAAFVAELAAIAIEVARTGAAADAVDPTKRVTQRQLDLHDGRVLHLVRIVERAFNAAHEHDATILVPRLGAMAAAFDGHRGGGGAAAGGESGEPGRDGEGGKTGP